MMTCRLEESIRTDYLDSYFGNPDHKEWTLSLYNALNDSHYDNPEDIEFNTIIEATHDDSFLKRFLTGHRAEVKCMYLTEYGEEKERIRTLREGREEGREEGRAEGLTEGRNEERTRLVSEMLKKNLPLTLIGEISQLSKDVIYSIAKNIGVAVKTD